MEINQLQSFYEIVKTGSFSKASQKVFVTQSAVSHQIKNIEKEFNIKLFQRIGRTIKLTEEGEVLFNVADKFFKDLEKLKTIFEDIQNCRFGHLTIAASSAIITYVLPNIIKRFIKQFPRIKLKLITRGITPELIPLVSEGQVDFAIGPKLNQPLPPQIDFLSWKSFDKILLVAKNHPLSKKKTIHLADIVAYPLILYRKGSVVRGTVEDTLIRHNLSYEIIMEVDEAEKIKNYVEMGIGLSILSSISINPTDKRRFSLYNVRHLLGKMDYGIYCRQDKYVSAAMKKFLKLFSSKIAKALKS